MLLEHLPPIAGPNPSGATQMLFYGKTIGHLHEVAAHAFAAPTQGLARRVHEEPHDEPTFFFYRERTDEAPRTEPAALQDPEREVDRADSPELAAVEDLRRWLNVSYADIATIAGWSSPSIIFYWRKRRQRGSRPRPRASTVERLYRVHSVLRALAEALEGEQGVQAVQLWAHNGGSDGVRPLELLLKGRLEEVYDQARPLLFDVSPRRPPVTQTLLLEEETVGNNELPPAPRRVFGTADFE